MMPRQFATPWPASAQSAALSSLQQATEAEELQPLTQPELLLAVVQKWGGHGDAVVEWWFWIKWLSGNFPLSKNNRLIGEPPVLRLVK